MLAGDVPTHGGIVHLVGGGDGEDVRGARHAASRRARAVAEAELVKVESDLANVLRLPLDEVDAGPGDTVGGGEARVLELGHVGGDDSPARDEPHHAARPEAAGTAALCLAALKKRRQTTSR